MRLQIEVHAPSNGCTATGIISDVDTGAHAIYARDRNGRWIALAGASSRNGNVMVAESNHPLLPIEIEGDLNRAHDLAARRAKAVRSYSTVINPASAVDTYA
jgi:hypothetical protein